MYQNHTPLFPQGVVSQYHYSDFKIDDSVLEAVEVGNRINNIITSQRESKANENIFDNPNFNNIQQFCIRSLEHYFYEVENIDVEEYWISASWINFCFPTGFQEFHNHANSIYSGCFYINVDKEQPGLTFKRENKNQDPYFKLYNKRDNILHADEATLKVSTGDLLLFPSYMVHGHSKNTSNETRISLAFNVLLNQPEDKAPPGWYHVKFKK